MGEKQYHLTDHLGNVRATVSDIKEPSGGGFFTKTFTAASFYPFGFMEEGRFFFGGSNRWGFNGMEKDDEIKGAGNSLTTEFRMNDPRIGGRWWSLDPKPNPSISRYAGYDNNPVFYSDPRGDTVVSDQASWDKTNIGLKNTLGPDHPFSYNNKTRRWEINYNFDISNYNSEQLEVYEKVKRNIEDPIFVNMVTQSGSANLTYYWGGGKTRKLDNLFGNGLADPVFDANGNLTSVNIYFKDIVMANEREQKEVDSWEYGIIALHELGHSYLYLTHPNWKVFQTRGFYMKDNCMETTLWEIRFRSIYKVPSGWRKNFLNPIRVFFGLDPLDVKVPIGGDPKEFHNEDEEDIIDSMRDQGLIK